MWGCDREGGRGGVGRFGRRRKKERRVEILSPVTVGGRSVKTVEETEK